MTAPPSLDPAVLQRAWTARNGELGLRPADVGAFLDACDRDGFRVLGWDLWIVDHAASDTWQPSPRAGSWFGMIPTVAGTTSVFGGDCDAAATRDEVAEFQFDAIDPRWHPFLRVNVTYRPRSGDGVA